MKRSILVTLAVLALATLFLAVPKRASAYREWAVGEWRLWQHFSEHHEEQTFKGRLVIRRFEGHFHGRIYFDVLGEWEHLEDVEVGDETIRFTRPKYGQEFHGSRHGDRLEGTYRDRLRGDREWTWGAEKD